MLDKKGKVLHKEEQMVAPKHHEKRWKSRPKERQLKRPRQKRGADFGKRKRILDPEENKVFKHDIRMRRKEEAERRWKEPRGTKEETKERRARLKEKARTSKTDVKILPNFERREDQDEPKKQGQNPSICHAKWQVKRMTKEDWTREQEEGKEEKKGGKKKDERFGYREVRGVRCCKQCGSVWNRDTAAALNILAIYKAMVETNNRPIRFTPCNNINI